LRWGLVRASAKIPDFMIFGSSTVIMPCFMESSKF